MLRKMTVFIVALLTGMAFSVSVQAQWKFDRKINFPQSDKSYVQASLCTVADNGNLYVLSSKSVNLKAHDAIWYLTPGDTLMSKMTDFFDRGDTMNIRMLDGITHIKNSIIVSGRVNPIVWAGGQSCSYYYPDGDTAKAVRYGYAPYLSGWGTFVFGIAATKDSIIIGGTDYTKGLRFYNFSKNLKSGYGAYMAPDLQNVEPGGLSDAGFDVIRDIALLPGGDYFNPAVPVYSSRNSKTSGELNGGICVWTGGMQYDKALKVPGAHVNYAGLRVSDVNDDLKFSSSIPYGITVDTDGLLWVAGIDSTRRWVKGFKVEQGALSANATLMDELPSAGKMIDSDPEGAPMRGPSDVAFSSDGKTAYVVDAWAACVYKFTKNGTGVETTSRVPDEFKLAQNYPNPFNPSTTITYSVPAGTHVSLIVSNILGQEVASLVNKVVTAGSHSVQFDASGLTSGIYLYTLKTAGGIVTNKMILMK